MRKLKRLSHHFFAFFQSASAAFGSTAYARTPSVTALVGTSSGTISARWQFSQYRPPTSPAGATTAAHTEVAAPCAILLRCKGGAHPPRPFCSWWVSELLDKITRAGKQY